MRIVCSMKFVALELLTSIREGGQSVKGVEKYDGVLS